MTNFFTSRETAYKPRVSDTTAIDLTTITTPFGLLDDATQAALNAHGGPYEAYFYRGWGACEPGFTPSTAYRVATTYTPDDVPWDAVDDRFNWYARDENGGLYFYAKKPGTVAMFKQWEDGGELAPADCLKITIGNAPWDKSVQRRTPNDRISPKSQHDRRNKRFNANCSKANADR